MCKITIAKLVTPDWSIKKGYSMSRGKLIAISLGAYVIDFTWK